MAAGNTYTAIATQTLGSAAASVTFSSIPSTYTDLVLVINALGYFGSNTYVNGKMQVNGDTGTNYSTTALYGSGTTAGSFRASTQSSWTNPFFIVPANSTDNNIRGTTVINLMNYSNATTYKTVLVRSNVTGTTAGGETQATVNLWRSTAAITSMTITNNDSATGFVAGTFTLYGIVAA